MKQVHQNLYVGNSEDCNYLKHKNTWAIIHACKYPCYKNCVSSSISSLDYEQGNNDYLFKVINNNLYLNIVDMKDELQTRYTNPIITEAFKFINKYIKNNNILIHCNQGQSRSATIAMLYLAKNNIITNISYNAACLDFIKLYPLFVSGVGIKKYCENNWQNILTL